jgi:hypothetical protein
LSITSLSHDDIYDDPEDWVCVNYTNHRLPYGCYKACVRSDDGETSGFVHFEIVEIELSAQKDSTGTTINYSVQGGVPYLIRRERKDGMYGGIIDDITESPIRVGWTDYSVRNYIKIYAKGKYGTAVKRVYMGE